MTRKQPRHLTTCATPGCPTLTHDGYCPQHKPPARPGRTMPRDWKQTRQRIIQRDNAICQLQLPGCTTTATSADHITPISRGGTEDDTNLTACCWHCNQKKGNRTA
jgi:5-methylcytosine-specific restriction enzyme A